jgi:hypothetical protein
VPGLEYSQQKAPPPFLPNPSSSNKKISKTMSGREKYNIGGVDKEGHRYMNVRCPVHIFFTALSAQIIIEAFIREAFLFPRRLAGF